MTDPSPFRKEDNELESKLTVEARSESRAHSTEHFSDEDPITEINVTPLVDVALVLVIIFMAVSPFMLQTALEVSHSTQGAATGKAALDENIQIALKIDGTITVDGTVVVLEELAETIRTKLPRTKDQLVTISSDDKNLVGQVVQILDIAKQQGAKKVAIVSAPKPLTPSSEK